jgi:hypothetical protein
MNTQNTVHVLRETAYAMITRKGETVFLGYGARTERVWTAVPAKAILVDNYLAASRDVFEANIRSIVEGNS